MNKLLIAGLALGVTTLAAAPAMAKPYPAGGVTPDEVAAVLRGKGLKAEIGTTGNGTPKISSGAGGVNWSVYFYNCKDSRCASIQFSAGFDLDDGLTYAKANEWNYNKRFARAALDEEMDPYVRYDIDAEKGLTSEAVELAVETWQIVAPAFAEFIGYN